MDRTTFLFFILCISFVVAAPTENKLPSDGFLELYNSTTIDDVDPPSQNVSKASMNPPQPLPPITIPLVSSNAPFMFPRPFSIPFPFPFPPPPPLPPQLVQVVTVPRPQKRIADDDDDDDDDEDEDSTEVEEVEVPELIIPVEIPIDSPLQGRRAPVPNRRKQKPKKPTKGKRGKKPKKKKQKKQKKQKQPQYPQPIIIYQNQEEPIPGTDGTQPGMSGTQGTQSSYLGYYMVYVVEVRWTGNNYTQTVVTGRPIPAAITVPPTDSGLVNNLSETIVPANLVNGNRPQPTPTCLFQRSTTTEHFGTQPEIYNPLESTDIPVVDAGEPIGEETEDSEDLDSLEEEYENDSDPKRRKKKKQLVTTTETPKN